MDVAGQIELVVVPHVSVCTASAKSSGISLWPVTTRAVRTRTTARARKTRTTTHARLWEMSHARVHVDELEARDDDLAEEFQHVVGLEQVLLAHQLLDPESGHLVLLLLHQLADLLLRQLVLLLPLLLLQAAVPCQARESWL